MSFSPDAMTVWYIKLSSIASIAIDLSITALWIIFNRGEYILLIKSMIIIIAYNLGKMTWLYYF